MRTLPNRYACYYGPGQLPELAAYDLAILQSGHYGLAETAWLRESGTQMAAYLALGEEPTPPTPSLWTLLDPATGRPATNPAWGTTLVDCRSPAWRAHILERAIPDILARGFDGLFLDTLDTPERYPETQTAVISLIQQIRQCYPDLLLIANRGFSILEQIEGWLDAFLFEAFTTHYDNGRYATWDPQNLDWTARQAARLLALRGQRPLLALDYAAPDDHALRRLAAHRAQSYGFLSYTTTWNLDQLTSDN